MFYSLVIIEHIKYCAIRTDGRLLPCMIHRFLYLREDFISE